MSNQAQSREFIAVAGSTQVAMAYVSLDWIDAAALSWAAAGIYPLQALDWIALGITPSTAARLERDGERPMSVALTWWQAGIPPEEVAPWLAAGLTPTEAVAQRAGGVTADRAAVLGALRDDG